MATSKMLTQEDLMEMFGVVRTTIDRFMRTKGFPQFYRIGNARRWDADEVDKWKRSNRSGRNSQMDAAHAARAKARESASEAA